MKKKIISVLLVMAMLTAIVCAGSFSTSAADSGVPEWAVDNAQAKYAKSPTGAGLPSSYDLRSEGVVTPVKLQNPWGTCWSFGGSAAAEISILSSMGATAKETGLNLSERHLAYFAHKPITEVENPAQAGEGMYIIGDDVNKEFVGGDLGLFTTIYSQGVGPVSSSLFPYRGKNNIYDSSAGTYSKDDDWSIPDTNDKGNSNRLINGGFVLKDGNVLPKYWEDGASSPSDKAMTAIRQELLNGRGVALSYNADQSGKYAPSDAEHGMLYAQYCRDEMGGDHAVCIVGYDDNYKASNFTHTKDRMGNQLTDDEGNELSDEDAKALTTPPADGAWIVKNSWGSETEATVDELGNPVNGMAYGVKNSEGKATGYFYLSYYDRTIDTTESMEFSQNLAGQGEFGILQHDYMPSLATKVNYKEDSVISTANIFNADSPVELKSVSANATEENTRVTFAIYKLSENAKNPADGTLLRKFSRNFQYGGFHRVDLDLPITFDEGERFSIVTTESIINDDGTKSYTASAALNSGKDLVEQAGLTAYCVSVVNEGESFMYAENEWTDWTESIKELTADGQTYHGAAIDNFSIKAYVVPVYTDINTCSVSSISSKTYTGKEITPAVTVRNGSKVLENGKDYTLTYKNNINAGTASVTIVGEGSYKGAKTITFKINKAANPVEVTAKKTVTVKANKKTTVKKAVIVTKAQGKLTYKTNNKKVKIKPVDNLHPGTCNMIVSKGLKKGKTYSVKVTVTSMGSANYLPKTIVKTIKVKVK